MKWKAFWCHQGQVVFSYSFWSTQVCRFWGSHHEWNVICFPSGGCHFSGEKLYFANSMEFLALGRNNGVDVFCWRSVLSPPFYYWATAKLYFSSVCCPTSIVTCRIPKKKDESQSHKTTSEACSPAASNNAILAAIANQGVELAKVSKLVDELKKSMEGCFDSIEACLSTVQRAPQSWMSLDDLDKTLSAADNHIMVLEATCNELQVVNGPHRAKVNNFQTNKQIKFY